MQRRNFLQTASFLAVGAMLPTNSSGCQNQQQLDQIGIQLYTVRDAMQRDADETLRRVAEVGYDYVEGAKYAQGLLYGQSARSFKALLEKYGLRMPSGHVSYEDIQTDPDRIVEAAKEVGQEYLVIPYLAEEQRTKEGYQALADLLNTFGEQCNRYGIQLAYHNHDFEFNRMIAGSRPFDFLLAETDPDLVKYELDLYWVTRAGSKYQKYFDEYPGRFPLWHVKDMDDTVEKYFAAVGEGVMDWPAIFAQQELAGMQYFFVEQDHMRPGKKPFDEIRSSYTYLESMRF